MAAEQTGVLVIRVWLEDGSLRARITRSLDASDPSSPATAGASEDEIVPAVQAWLEEFREAVTPR